MPLEIALLRQVWLASGLGEHLIFIILREVRPDVVDVKRVVAFYPRLDELQLGGGSVDVDHSG